MKFKVLNKKKSIPMFQWIEMPDDLDSISQISFNENNLNFKNHYYFIVKVEQIINWMNNIGIIPWATYKIYKVN